MTIPNLNDSYLQLRMPPKFINGFVPYRGSNTTLIVNAGQARDSDDLNNMVDTTTNTINAAVVGANGIDTGTLAASSLYYIYKATDPSGKIDPCSFISLSATAPVAPTVNNVTYQSLRIVGHWWTDGSTHFLENHITGEGNDRQYSYDQSVAVLTGGTATSLTAIDLSSVIPPFTKTLVKITADFTPATAGDKASFASFGSTATLLPHVTSSVAAKVNSGQIEVLARLDTATPKILYINSASSGSTTAWINSYKFTV